MSTALTTSERTALVHLARQLGACDGKSHERERQFLHALGGGMDLYRELAQPRSFEEAAGAIRSRAAREEAMRELQILARVDGELAAAEAAFLGKLAIAWELEACEAFPALPHGRRIAPDPTF